MAAALPIAATAAGGLQAGGQMFSALAAGGAANYSAQVAKNNALTEQRNAAYAIGAGGVHAEATSLANAQRGGLIKAGQAANGVDVNSGSAVDVQASQKQIGELDTLTAMNNAAMQAYGYQVQSTGYDAQAKLDETQAAEAPIAGALGAAGSLLGNAPSYGKSLGGGS